MNVFENSDNTPTEILTDDTPIVESSSSESPQVDATIEELANTLKIVKIHKENEVNDDGYTPEVDDDDDDLNVPTMPKKRSKSINRTEYRSSSRLALKPKLNKASMIFADNKTPRRDRSKSRKASSTRAASKSRGRSGSRGRKASRSRKSGRSRSRSKKRA